MSLPCVRAFNALRNRTPSFHRCVRNALEFCSRGLPWITVLFSTGGYRTIFHVPILVGSRIFWNGFVFELILPVDSQPWGILYVVNPSHLCPWSVVVILDPELGGFVEEMKWRNFSGKKTIAGGGKRNSATSTHDDKQTTDEKQSPRGATTTCLCRSKEEMLGAGMSLECLCC